MPLSPAPIQQPVVNQNGILDVIWIKWFSALVSQINTIVDGGGP